MDQLDELTELAARVRETRDVWTALVENFLRKPDDLQARDEEYQAMCAYKDARNEFLRVALLYFEP